jgi:hypothetical protein
MRTPRQSVIDRLDLIGCGYIDRDTVSARCPLCAGVLAVTFSDIAVRFRCCDSPDCDEHIARIVFGRDRETDELVNAHRARLVDVFMTAADDEPLEIAA